jgi:predicted naringenin-chalcone synthase
MKAGASVFGLAVAAPPGRLSQEAAAALAEARCSGDARERAWLRRIYRASGVNERASVLLAPKGAASLETFYPPPAEANDYGPTTATRLARYLAEAPSLAARAAGAALQDAGIAPGEITQIITVSCTGPMSPGLDIALIDRLGLSPGVGRLNLGFMGCHGALNGLRAARAFASADSRARVLLCCAELCTLHFQYGRNSQQMVANALFADGAGAVILGHAEPGMPRLVGTASQIAPDSRAAMTWHIGDHGFEMGLAPEVPSLIRGALAEWLGGWLSGYDMNIGDIAHWAIHPGGPKIVRAAREALALPEPAGADSMAVLAEHGNMSSPTILFILERLRARNARGPCVALGFGPGLAFEAALFDL